LTPHRYTLRILQPCPPFFSLTYLVIFHLVEKFEQLEEAVVSHCFNNYVSPKCCIQWVTVNFYLILLIIEHLFISVHHDKSLRCFGDLWNHPCLYPLKHIKSVIGDGGKIFLEIVLLWASYFLLDLWNFLKGEMASLRNKYCHVDHELIYNTTWCLKFHS
jgi:hypothetical protein